MFFDPDNPNVSRQDWQRFSLQLPPYFETTIDRETTEMPYWLSPLARGMLITGPMLLRQTGYTPNTRCPPHWTPLGSDVYHRDVGKTRLRVRLTNDRRFWILSRWRPGIRMSSDTYSETIVHLFGSTPLATRKPDEAMHLADFFQENDPIAQLRWAATYTLGDLARATQRAEREGLDIKWDALWASGSHSRRMILRHRSHSNEPLLPPVAVRTALQWPRSTDFAQRSE